MAQSISVQDFNKLPLDADSIVLDTRNTLDYTKNHLSHSLSIPAAILPRQLKIEINAYKRDRGKNLQSSIVPWIFSHLSLFVILSAFSTDFLHKEKRLLCTIQKHE